MNKVRDGYRMTEIGEIPNEWEIKSIGEIFDFSGGLSIPRAKLTNKGVNYLHYGDIHVRNENYIDTEKDEDWLPKIEEKFEEIKENVKLNSGDVVFADASEDYEGVGKSVVIFNDSEKPFVSGLHTIVAKDINNQLYKMYKRYCFSTNEVRKQFRYLAVGTSVYGISRENIKKIKINIPTIQEQEKIASILSTVDEQIDNVDALIEKNKELKKGLMQTLLTKGIGHTKFKKTEVGEIPSEWDIKSIDEITKEVYRYPTYYGIEYVEEGIAEIRGELLNDDASIKKESFRYISEKTAKKFPRTKLEVGDIVISVRGTIGKVGYITEELVGSNITANLLRVSMNRNIMNEHFVKQLFLSDIMKRKFDEITTATTIKTFKVPEFKQIILAIPTKDEQDKIASILLEVDKKIEEHENKKQKLENLKKGLMQQLLTGKIRTI